MKKEYAISIYLDTRRSKTNNKYPVKLRVYTSNPRKQKLYPTIFELTEKEFNSVWLTNKPRGDNNDLRLKIQAIENKANKIAEKLTPFTLDEFEKKLYRKRSDGNKVSYHYKELIADYLKNDRLGTADSYSYSEKAIKEFVENTRKNSYNNLTFYDIDKNWLNEFERHMLGKKRSPTTIGIYLRPLRAIFNKAIEERDIEPDIYPFGKRKYQIPSSRKVKKALSAEQLKTLYNSNPDTPEQIKAKDFWFFSYNSNGMNIKDIALLKFKDLDGETIKFFRAKTRFTSKSDLQVITVFINNYMKDFIEKYCNSNKNPDNFVFNIISNNDDVKKQRDKIKNFTRYINQHLKVLCANIGLPSDISSYWARHSFATTSIRKGASLELMQESLGHKDVKTTQSYFDGFEDETKKELSNNLMDF
jgi:site-specific recombinase XerD